MKRHWTIKALALALGLILFCLAFAEEVEEASVPVSPTQEDGAAVEEPQEEMPEPAGELIIEAVDETAVAATADQPAPADPAPDASPAEPPAQPEAPAGAEPSEGDGAPAEEGQAPTDGGNIEGEAPENGAEQPTVTAPEAEAPAEEPPTDGEASAEEPPTEGEVAAPEAEAPDLRLGVGETCTLEGEKGTFASDRPEVASVDAESGDVTAASVGQAVVTAVGKDGTPTRWIVAVLKAPEKLTLNKTKLSLGKGEKRQLEVRLDEDAAASQIKFKSSKSSVASVDASGVVKAKKAGTAVITAVAYNGVKAKCTVKVCKAPSKVSLSAKNLALCVGETGTLKAKLPDKTASGITWTSSDDGIVTVDGAGALRGVAAGTATVKAVTFNGKKASCKVTVLEGAIPTTLNAGVTTLILGVKEKFRLSPAVGEGESTMFAYASSKKKVATVSSEGVVTAKKSGTAWIAVTTHNGLKTKVKVKVSKAPSKVTLSRNKLSMRVGETAALSAWLPSGTSSALTWSSSDASVATVDAEGNITALKAGVANIKVQTFNNKSKQCAVTVTDAGPSVDDDPEEDTSVDDGEPPEAEKPTASKMIDNLRKSSALGNKKKAIVNVVELLIANGFEPAFAAGVGANIYAEGTYGMFESSRYVTNPKKRPRYFCYLDGGNYYTYKNGEYTLTAVYMSEEEMADYEDEAEARKRFGEKDFYLNNYSKKYVQNVDLDQLEALMETLAAGKWEGKFGLGIVQWTGSRTKTLVSFYRKHAGKGSSITAEQVIAAENEMILSDFTGNYKGVYSAWKKENKNGYASAEAAGSAGKLVCTKYEIPADKENKAVTRGKKAEEIYNIMVG